MSGQRGVNSKVHQAGVSVFVGIRNARSVSSVEREWKIYTGANEPLIVTELVGEEVIRDADGKLYVDDEENRALIDKYDEREIYESALDGLKKATFGWVSTEQHHRAASLSLRNIRVQRGKREPDGSLMDSRSTWKVWWIDFGRSVRCQFYKSKTWYTDSEEADCQSMFHTRQKDEDGSNMESSE